MHLYLLSFVVLTFFVETFAEERNHKKRQIYREEVLPHAGGKIPDTAFETDRLFLNRLQKEGIAVPDGVLTEQRNPQVNQYLNRSPRVVFHIALSSDERYIPAEGRPRYNEVPTVETTYLYPQVHGHKVDFVPIAPAYPVYRQLQLYNSQLNQAKLQPKKKMRYVELTPSSHHSNRGRTKSYKTHSYQNFNILNAPVRATAPPVPTVPAFTANNYYLSKYDSSADLFNTFDELFENFNLNENGAYKIK